MAPERFGRQALAERERPAPEPEKGMQDRWLAALQPVFPALLSSKNKTRQRALVTGHAIHINIKLMCGQNLP